MQRESWGRGGVLGRGSIRKISSAFSTLSTPRKPAGWGWGYRSAGRLSMLTGAGCGRAQMSLEAPYFSSSCLTRKGKSWLLVRQLCIRESGTKTAYQMPLVHRLAKVTNDPFVQG